MSFTVKANIKNNRIPAAKQAIRKEAGEIVLKHAVGCAAVLYDIYPVGPAHTGARATVPHTRDTIAIMVGEQSVAQKGNFSQQFVSDGKLTAKIITQYASKVKTDGVRLVIAGAAFFIEWGTIFMEARPLIRAQVKRAKANITNDLRKLNVRLSK